MSINFKAAVLVLCAASLFGVGQASAAGCDGSIQQTRNGRTVQCYYLPTVSNGHYIGLQKQVNYGTYDNRYSHPGAVIGGGTGGGSHYPPVRHR